MAPDHASRDRAAALGTPSAPSAPSPEGPDPEFWGAEPRRVRRARRGRPEPAAIAPEWWHAAAARVRDIRFDVGVGVVAIVVVAVVAGVVWYRMSAGDGPAASARPAATRAAGDRRPSAAPAPAAATAVTPTSPSGAARRRGATVVVHVAGAVVRPGVLLMPAGARVIDAVEGAGGATPEADLDRINLATKLVDGQRILVAKVGAVAPADVTGSAAVAGDPGAPIDLNVATAAQLETLPGIGPTLAGAIIAERDRRGGFRSVNELREVRGIGEARFADLRERVSV